VCKTRAACFDFRPVLECRQDFGPVNTAALQTRQGAHLRFAELDPSQMSDPDEKYTSHSPTTTLIKIISHSASPIPASGANSHVYSDPR